MYLCLTIGVFIQSQATERAIYNRLS